MKSFVLALAAAAAVVPAAASAQVFDAFDTFNGTQGAGNFIYGEADPANPNASGTFFMGNTNCFISGSTCLQRDNTPNVPGVTKSTTESFQYGTVNVPDDRLLAHPGNDTLQTFLAFVAPSAGFYTFKATFTIQDVNPTGVGINLIRTTNGGLPLIFSPLAVINAQNPSFSITRVFNLGASEAVGFGLDANGNFSNDSTGVQFAVAAGVPETATWTMMILGFGVVGGALRRSRRVKVSYAAA